MKRHALQAAAGLALSMALALTAQANPMIGINFVGGDGGDQGTGGPPPIDFAQTAGVIPQGFWNNVAKGGGNANGGPLTLLDDSGAITTAKVSWTSSNLWTGSGTPDTGDARLMTGYLDSGNSATTGVNVTLTGVPFAAYDVIVYVDGDAGPPTVRKGDYTITRGSYSITQSATDPGNFATGTGYVRSDGLGGPGNYLVFKGISGTDFVLSSLAGDSGGGPFSGFRAPINGLQLVQIPEPTGLALFALGGALVALWRRRG